MEIKKCSKENCNRIVVAKGLCWAHYRRIRDSKIRGKSPIPDSVPIAVQKKYIVKRCVNHLCGKLIYFYQEGNKNLHCCEECVQEERHWRTATGQITRKKLSTVE